MSDRSDYQRRWLADGARVNPGVSDGSDAAVPAADGPPAPDPPAAGRRLEYDGAGGPITKIAISNALRTLATLGVYRFWGKTRMRRYLWSRASFLGDRAEYTGLGRELLLGFLIAIAVLALLSGVLFGVEMAVDVGHPFYWASQGVYSLTILFLVFVAEYRARRYRLSRTEWRSIRFAQSGSSLRYALLALGWGAVTLLSLGVAYPVHRVRLQRYRTTHTSFGDRPFRFEGRARALMKTWLLAWLFLLPTLGLTYVWYRTREFRYFAGKSRCGALSFASDLGAGSTIRIVVVFVLLAGLTVGLLFAAIIVLAAANPEWVESMQRAGASLPFGLGEIDLMGYVLGLAVFFPAIALLRVRFLVHPLFRRVLRSVTVIGEEDFGAIAQRAQSMPRHGEGLADALDVGAV